MPSNADLQQQIMAPQIQAPVVSFNAASAQSNGAAYDNGVITRSVAVQITSSAALTAGGIQVQASLDGVNWANVGAPIVATNDFPAATTKIYSFGADTSGSAQLWRVTIPTALTGGTITAKIKGI